MAGTIPSTETTPLGLVCSTVTQMFIGTYRRVVADFLAVTPEAKAAASTLSFDIVVVRDSIAIKVEPHPLFDLQQLQRVATIVTNLEAV